MNVKERSTVKSYCVVTLFPMLAKYRLVNHFKKCGLFLITNMVSGLSFLIYKVFDKVLHAGLIHKVKFFRNSA